MTRRARRITRREFVGGAVAAAGVIAGAPAILRGRNLNDKLNIAMIGVGGRGAANLKGVGAENVVALCDVNRLAVEAAAAQYPQAQRFSDLRKVFDHASDFDAVVVSTCEHTHAFSTMLALEAGKHVYCEKPLAYNIWETRRIREKAATVRVATQMGIQIHAGDNYHRVVELVQSGAIGPVREAHVWVGRTWGLQSKEGADRNKDVVYVTSRPDPEPAPPELDWDLWLGPAPARPFSSVYVPGPKWYRWWDFGNGTMSDLGSHWNDLPFWALELHAPLTIEATGGPRHPEIAPATMSATYEYAARGDMPPVTLTFHQGEDKPQIWQDGGIPQWQSGCLFIGQKGMILADYTKHVLLPEKAFADFVPPPQTIPKSPGHYAEWIEACKNGSPTSANFEYGGWLTEANHLGNVAFRAGKKLEWDPVKMRATNAPEADRFIKREYRKGWEGIL
jgi:predicted dehydrogenase